MLTGLLKPISSAKIVVTTPHPSVSWLHGFGSKLGIFSKHANEEHKDLLGRKKLERVGTAAKLRMDLYRRFLFGGNQIAIYSREFLNKR